MSSKTDILNLAAMHLGSERVVADEAGDNHPRARTLVSAYPIVYDNVLSMWPWACARGRHKLVADVDNPPAFGFTNAFILPSRVIRPVSVRTGGTGWEFEQRRVLANCSGPLDVISTDRVSEELLSPSVAVLVGVSLAFHVAQSGASSRTIKMDLSRYVQDALVTAMTSENATGGSEYLAGSGWVLALETGYSDADPARYEHYLMKDIEVAS